MSPLYFAEQIAAGILVRPFEAELDHKVAHYLVYDRNRAREPKIRSFVEWMLFQPMAFCLNQPAPAFPDAGETV